MNKNHYIYIYIYIYIYRHRLKERIQYKIENHHYYLKILIRILFFVKLLLSYFKFKLNKFYKNVQN